MEFKKMHRAYKPTLGGTSIPADRLINDLGESAIHYVGTVADNYAISIKPSASGYAFAYIRKNWDNGSFHHDIKLSGLRSQIACSHAGGDVQNNGGIAFSKQDLLRIANAMNDSDTFEVIQIDSHSSNLEIVAEAIKKVTD